MSFIILRDVSAHVLVQSAVANGSDGELPPGFLYKVRLHLYKLCTYIDDTVRFILGKILLFCLLQVKVIHDYASTDGDELELKIGDAVLVLAFDSPDEQVSDWNLFFLFFLLHLHLGTWPLFVLVIFT